MWNERYSQPGFLFGTEPARFLVEQAHHLKRGDRVLVIADGEGRNSVWLAEQGMRVTAQDASEVAIDKARGLAAARSAPVEYIHSDLRDWDWTPDAWDAVVAIFIQFAEPAFRERIFAGMKRTVKPGGVILLHGYTPRQLDYGTGGPSCAENMYTAEMLRAAFAGFEVLRLEEYDRKLQEGTGHSGMSALIDLVARKPG